MHTAAPDLPTLFALLERLPLGVVLLDQTGRVLLYNSAEEQIARRKREDVLGRAFFEDIAPCIRDAGVGAEFHGRIGREEFSVEKEIAFAFPYRDSPRIVQLRLTSVEAEGKPYGCLLLEDVTAKRALERLKENLSALLVHDLKNPLSAVLANLQLLEMLPGDKGAIDGARVSAERLQGMIGGLLDIARLEDGALPLKLAPHDLRELVDASLRGQAALAALHRVTLQQTSRPEPVRALVDVDVLRRTLDNLVDNALRYAPQGSRIEVWAEPGAKAGTVSLCVRDHGRGVPAELRERIFEKFSRGADRTRGVNHGLGLTFVRLAAEAHGGTVAVEEPASGPGSVFRLVLPDGTATLLR